jgi:phosphoribosylamine--glycine ligase
MKVLVIGGGGREHALVWKIRQSERVSRLYCAPGNGGICAEAECCSADAGNLDSLLEVTSRLAPDLTVIGPELPLALGLADELARRGLRVFGPTRAAAQLETSKSFAKEFMKRHRIPTAHFAVVDDAAKIKDAVALFSPPLVVKADGLAAGKGVVIAASRQEAEQVAAEMLSGKLLGPAGARVVFEECLAGDELSFLVLSDGSRVVPLAAAQDHKRVGEGDTGPNTGGMGAYSTEDLLDPQMQEWLIAHIARPVVDGMREEGVEYRGVLYCGLMMTARGPMVLEFNCRFGDPEAQPILMRMESDLVVALEACADGRLSEGDVAWSRDAAACVVLASEGYPGQPKTGVPISGIAEADAVPGVKVFHAGTRKTDAGLVASGGRVLGVTARAADLQSALDAAYAATAKIYFDGMHFRRDIGARALRKKT